MAGRPRVLIVNDDLRICDSLKLLLSWQGYEISTANSGQVALNILSKDAFDIVILDIVLSDINAHQIMEHISNCTLDTSVILITGNGTLESASEALKKGAYNYIEIPFKYDKLLKTVQNALNPIKD
jgi:DNA-binding NtrC family response regulator